MQALGLVHALDPALALLYPSPAALAEARARYLSPFNTHPYLAHALLGGLLHLELEIAAGARPPEAATSYRDSLAGPLAAAGDRFFWGALRPATVAFGLVLLPFLGAWAAAGALGVHLLIALGLRLHLFRAGLTLGEQVLGALVPLRLAPLSEPIRGASSALAGVACGLWLGAQPWVGTQPPPLGYTVIAGTLASLLLASGRPGSGRRASLVWGAIVASAAAGWWLGWALSPGTS